MTSPQFYFRLARKEERSGNLAPALIFYISSFCASCNTGHEHSAGTVAKIRRLQVHFGLNDAELCQMVRSYGILTDLECRYLLCFAISGNISGIHAVMSNE